MVELSGASTVSQELKDIMKKSLKQDRWNPLDLGDHKNYTAEAVSERWEKNRREWLAVSYWRAHYLAGKKIGQEQRE